MTSFAKNNRRNASRWILLFTLIITLLGILQFSHLKSAFADTDGYPWAGAQCVDGTNCSTTYNWGYSLPCPSIDPNCLSYPYPNAKNPTAGMGDIWSYGVRNCTSYVAWKINEIFHVNVPSNLGNASTWASMAQKDHFGTVHSSSGYTPQVGDIAQWNSNHVAYVYAVNNGIASLDEYNSGWPRDSKGHLQWGLFYSGRTTAKGSAGMPDHYIHIGSLSNANPSTPVAVSRDNSDMAVFYNDGNSNLVNWSWNATTGWAQQQWSDSGGILGQPAVVSRTSDSMDVFYTTGQHKLIHKGWTASAGWAYFDVLLSSDVAGDPAVTARDSGDMQLFYRTLEGDIKSIYWSSVTGWNTNPQQLYVGAATTDPYAVSRGSGSMEVFFGKNNGYIVHLGWTPTYGWVTQDWSTNSSQSLPGKPTAVTYNSGGDMATYFQENGGNVGGESWDWQTGWSSQSWTAQLVGNPSAIPGVSNTVDDFYRETGGNIVDRYLIGGMWATTWIVGTGSATGNPFAITRGTTNEEVFYWNGTSLMDANWNTTSQAWSVSQVN